MKRKYFPKRHDRSGTSSGTGDGSRSSACGKPKRASSAQVRGGSPNRLRRRRPRGRAVAAVRRSHPHDPVHRPPVVGLRLQVLPPRPRPPAQRRDIAPGQQDSGVGDCAGGAASEAEKYFLDTHVRRREFSAAAGIGDVGLPVAEKFFRDQLESLVVELL